MSIAQRAAVCSGFSGCNVGILNRSCCAPIFGPDFGSTEQFISRLCLPSPHRRVYLCCTNNITSLLIDLLMPILALLKHLELGVVKPLRAGHGSEWLAHVAIGLRQLSNITISTRQYCNT